MRRSFVLVLSLLTALAVALAPSTATASSSSEAPTAAAAAKKKCKKGTRAVKVRSKGRTRTVCRKVKKRKPAPAASKGPSVAEVESIIRGIAQAGHETWLGPESVEVVFERPTQVLPMVMYNPYEADPLTATGKVETWPVRAWTRIVNHKDDTPADDTKYGGCLGHLNSWWPYDSLYMFFRGQSGEWTFLTSSANKGECG